MLDVLEDHSRARLHAVRGPHCLADSLVKNCSAAAWRVAPVGCGLPSARSSQTGRLVGEINDFQLSATRIAVAGRAGSHVSGREGPTLLAPCNWTDPIMRKRSAPAVLAQRCNPEKRRCQIALFEACNEITMRVPGQGLGRATARIIAAFSNAGRIALSRRAQSLRCLGHKLEGPCRPARSGCAPLPRPSR